MPDMDEKRRARKERQAQRAAEGRGNKFDTRLTFNDIKDERALSMVDKLCVWIGDMLGCKVNRGTFLAEIRNGEKLCKLAEIISHCVEEYSLCHPEEDDIPNLRCPTNFCECGPREPKALENVNQFLNWTKSLGVPESTIFEANDLLKIKNKMKVVNTLLAIARKAKTCGVEADVDAPPKINSAFKGLEKKFGGDGFSSTSAALGGGGQLKPSTVTLSTYSPWKRVQQKLDQILTLCGNVSYEIYREKEYEC